MTQDARPRSCPNRVLIVTSRCDAVTVRRLHFAIGALLSLGMLSGCSPSPLPIVAITVRDGQPTVVLVSCVGQFSQLGVYENDPDVSPKPTDDVLVSWSVYGDAATEIVEVAVFGQPPAGWETDGENQIGDPNEPGSFRVEPLEELISGVRYSASGDAQRDGISVGFTTADLDQLGDGEVLTADGYDDVRTISYDDFVRQARESRGECPRR